LQSPPCLKEGGTALAVGGFLKRCNINPYGIFDMFALQTRYVLRTRYVPLELDMLPYGNEKRTDAEWHIRPILNVDISQQFMIFKNQFMHRKVQFTMPLAAYHFAFCTLNSAFIWHACHHSFFISHS